MLLCVRYCDRFGSGIPLDVQCECFRDGEGIGGNIQNILVGETGVHRRPGSAAVRGAEDAATGAGIRVASSQFMVNSLRCIMKKSS